MRERSTGGSEWGGWPVLASPALATLLCVGCASAPQPAPTPAEISAQRMPPTSSPVSDFRMGSDNIPDVLVGAVADPYRRPVPFDCITLIGEVHDLDAVLGPDLDTIADADKVSGAANAFGSAVRSLIPYRSVIRFLTGAKQRERRAAAAIAAGGVRRAYLKGLGEQLKCAAPATPIRSPPTTAPKPF